MLLTDPPYGTTRNFWDVPLPLPELWEAVKWAVKPEGAVLLFAQCPYDKVLGASNLAMLRYEWVWYKSRCTGFLNARRAPLKKTENILVFYQKSPAYFPQFEQGKPYKKIHRCSGNSPNYGKFERTSGESEWAALSGECAGVSHSDNHRASHAEARGPVRVPDLHLHTPRRGGGGRLRWLRHNCRGRAEHGPPLRLL